MTVPTDFEFQDREAHFQTATEAANVALWSIVPETGETWFSNTWYTLLGYQPGEFAPSFDQFMELMHDEDRKLTMVAFKNLVEERTPIYAADFRLRDRHGEWRWIGATGAKVVRGPGRPDIVYGIQMDITARKETEAELAQTALTAEEHRQRLARLAENSPAALFEFRIDADGVVTMPYITAPVHELLGVNVQDIWEDGLNAFSNIFEEDVKEMGRLIEQSRVGLTPFRMRYRVKRPDTQMGFIWAQANSVPHREADGSTIWFGSVFDVTLEVEREAMLAEARDAMRHLALHDGLTGLPNRRRFDDILKERAKIPAKQGPSAVLIRIDLDRFKYVNDTLGHPAGDAVLAHVAGILQDVVANEGLACRVGGDEFCILMTVGKTVDDAKDLVATIQELLEIPFVFDGKVCRYGASFGIASSEQGNIGNGDLMSFADAALYEAKAAGRGRLAIFSKDLHDEILESRRLAASIENALENGEFEPYFQPQICARTGALIGAEVLARWNTASGQVILPEKFMPVAEQIRAVPLIDKMMVEKAVEVVEDWHAQGFMLPKLSFNVSAGRLREHAIVSNVRILQERGVTVAFELLESILLEEEDGVLRHNLDRARDAGIQLEVDDFGTGHASILGLLQVGPEVLKIDRRLTAHVVESDQSSELVASILGIARSLGIQTTAEGVETEEQAKKLRDLGCNVFQGYLYARPLSGVALRQWAHENGFVPEIPQQTARPNLSA
ncbi:MAG: EAL domain-containing protein [Pseudomonadota bacterium]